MEVILGKFAGFCPGVKSAWNLVEKTARENRGPTFILGELIHNRQALERIERWGIKTVTNLTQIKDRESAVIIRAHGEPPQTFQKLKERKLKTINATCPSVARVQKLAQKLEKEGYQVIVCGEKDHPEAKATVGYTKKGMIISSAEEAKKIPPKRKIGVVSQTTFSQNSFSQICQILKRKSSGFKSLGTICNFTQMAQKEGRRIAKEVDLMIIVGGKHSSNTKRLAEVVSRIKPSYHIETANEIKEKWFRRAKKVGLLAGASTPDWIIDETKKTLEGL